MRKTNIHPGDKVAFNTLSDAIWFDVISVDGFILKIREVDTNYAFQYMDCGYVKQWKKGS